MPFDPLKLGPGNAMHYHLIRADLPLLNTSSLHATNCPDILVTHFGKLYRLFSNSHLTGPTDGCVNLNRNLLTKIQTRAETLINRTWFIQALKVIEQYHGTQVRKVSGSWYGTEHLLTVAFMANYLFSNDNGTLDYKGIQLVITGLFHDILEDTTIGKRGLREVLGLIFEFVYNKEKKGVKEASSDDQPQPSKREWVDQIIANIDMLSAPHTRGAEICGVGISADPGHTNILDLQEKTVRKEAYLERLGNNASLEILLIKLCDRIANLMSDVAYVEPQSATGKEEKKPVGKLAYTLGDLEVFERCILSPALKEIGHNQSAIASFGSEIKKLYYDLKSELYPEKIVQ